MLAQIGIDTGGRRVQVQAHVQPGLEPLPRKRRRRRGDE